MSYPRANGEEGSKRERGATSSRKASPRVERTSVFDRPVRQFECLQSIRIWNEAI